MRPPHPTACASTRLGLWRAAALSFVVLISADLAAAQSEYARGTGELMQRFDRDGDGRVVEQEYLGYLALGFQVRDTNADGVLSGSELPPGAKPLTLAEHRARLQRQFRRQDTNGDGALDARELLAPPQG